jgi:hypothetical protein
MKKLLVNVLRIGSYVLFSLGVWIIVQGILWRTFFSGDAFATIAAIFFLVFQPALIIIAVEPPSEDSTASSTKPQRLTRDLLVLGSLGILFIFSSIIFYVFIFSVG